MAHVFGGRHQLRTERRERNGEKESGGRAAGRKREGGGGGGVGEQKLMQSNSINLYGKYIW